jgi:membrane fusion protein, multidrug efflux system
MRRTTRWVLATAVAAVLGAVGYVAVAEGRDEARSGRVVGRPAVAVDAATVMTADLTEAIDVVGSLAPKSTADVKSELSGIVRDVYVTEWVPVRKGARLARLETNELEAGIDAIKATAVQSRVAETRARRELDRAIQLLGFGLITSQQVDEARSALEAAEAASAAAAAQVRSAGARLQKCVLSSPIDGVVALRSVNVGDRVENMGGGEPLFRIVDNRTLELTVTVPTTRLADLRVGQPLEFTTDAAPGHIFTGRVMFINPAVDETSRAVKVVAAVGNADGVLKGGLFATGRIILETKRDVVQVPGQALQKWNMAGRTADVFVVRNGQAERRAVRTGTANGSSVEIVSGVLPGEEVVTRGAFAVKGGDSVKVTRTGKGA